MPADFIKVPHFEVAGFLMAWEEFDTKAAIISVKS